MFKFSTFFNVSPPCLLLSVLGYIIAVLTMHTVFVHPQAPALYTTDARAMNYILSHEADGYQDRVDTHGGRYDPCPIAFCATQCISAKLVGP